MKKGAKKEPEMVRIIAIDGSDILKHGITTRKDGKLYHDAFCGVLDESLDTLKMKKSSNGTRQSCRSRIWRTSSFAAP